MAKLSPPIKNKGTNKENVNVGTGRGGYLWFAEDGRQPLQQWEAFVTAHLVFDLASLLPMLRNNGSTALPTRFLRHEQIDRYLPFFSDVILSKGQCIDVM